MDDVNTEEKRKKRFMRGLNPFMTMQLRLTKAHLFQELVDAAITLEDDYKILREKGGRKLVWNLEGFKSERRNQN